MAKLFVFIALLVAVYAVVANDMEHEKTTENEKSLGVDGAEKNKPAIPDDGLGFLNPLGSKDGKIMEGLGMGSKENSQENSKENSKDSSKEKDNDKKGEKKHGQNKGKEGGH